MTTEEISRKLNRPQKWVQERLKDAHLRGVLRVAQKIMQRIDGISRKVPAYWIEE